ncbi:MAG: ABC transporter permease [Clostridiales Family XIII bacterium]|jgi:ABC-type dipeptide/oligopeptide/nickel transport system permease subunit|nr:ABC transporter permease [Clostridiales Family XIII bacterium]
MADAKERLDAQDDGLKKSSRLRETAKWLLRRKLSVVGLVIFVLYILIAIFAPYLSPYDYAGLDLSHMNEAPSSKYLLGTDNFGRDILTRLLYGTRYSLALGLGAASMGVAFGVILGCLAGFFGKWVEEIIMRFCDLMQAIPGTMLAVVISMVLGTGFGNTIIAVGIGRIPLNCRLLRAQFLSQRKLEYVEAAQATNCSKLRQMFVQILPNTVAPLIVNGTMGVGAAIMIAAGLSFINLGVQPPTPEWGAMITAAKEFIRQYPYQTIYPGLFMAVFVLALNLLGDGLRDAMDPKLKI